MDGLIIDWVGAIIIVSVVCVTVLKCAERYYRDQKEQRLERMDMALQNPQLANVDQVLVLSQIVGIAKTQAYPDRIGNHVLDILEKQQLITGARVRYVRTGQEQGV